MTHTSKTWASRWMSDSHTQSPAVGFIMISGERKQREEVSRLEQSLRRTHEEAKAAASAAQRKLEQAVRVFCIFMMTETVSSDKTNTRSLVGRGKAILPACTYVRFSAHLETKHFDCCCCCCHRNSLQKRSWSAQYWKSGRRTDPRSPPPSWPRAAG